MKLNFLAFLFILVFWASSFNVAVGQQANTTVQETGALFQQIEDELEQRGLNNPNVIIDMEMGGLQKIPGFIKLQKEVETTWPQIMGNIQGVAPLEDEKTILLLALESSLSADSYLKFVDQTVGLVENKTLDGQFLDWALFPQDKNMREVFAYNYDKPIVKDIMARVKMLYADKPNMIVFCDSIISGKAKKEAQGYHKDHPTEADSVPASQ